MSPRQPVAVVTGGGGGIGAAIAEELGLKGWFVATMDPLVSVDGSERLSEPAQTTADRIVAAGGSAASSQVSVTDAEGVASFFEQLARDHGGLDAVVNVAGITRPTGFAHGSDEDWRAVLEVHLDGYLNVLRAALPIMAASGHGRILGVTSGSGWRAADAGAYSCAKRAVASLTWQLGRHAPPGVTVNAISPIAATRMVAAALARAGQLGSATSASGQLGSATSAGGQPASTSARAGLSLESMPDPATLGPIACYLLSDTFAWCSATVVFAAGSEVAIVEEPRFIEVVRTGGVASLPRLLDAVIPGAFAPAEAKQLTTGGANPRFGSIFDQAFDQAFDQTAAGAAGAASAGRTRSCAVISDRPRLAAAIADALKARSIACRSVEPTSGPIGDASPLESLAAGPEPIDAVVVALSPGPRRDAARGSESAGSVTGSGPPGGSDASGVAEGWARTLAEHQGIVEDIHCDARWARAAADLAAKSGRRLQLVSLVDATTAGGRSRAQAAAQLARSAGGATKDLVGAYTASLEAPEQAASDAAAALVAHLLSHPGAARLAGAELAIGDGWVGLRAHPRPAGSVVYGGPEVPDWLDGALREIAARQRR